MILLDLTFYRTVRHIDHKGPPSRSVTKDFFTPGLQVFTGFRFYWRYGRCTCWPWFLHVITVFWERASNFTKESCPPFSRGYVGDTISVKGKLFKFEQPLTSHSLLQHKWLEIILMCHAYAYSDIFQTISTTLSFSEKCNSGKLPNRKTTRIIINVNKLVLR